jgi:hypothetical protein
MDISEKLSIYVTSMNRYGLDSCEEKEAFDRFANDKEFKKLASFARILRQQHEEYIEKRQQQGNLMPFVIFLALIGIAVLMLVLLVLWR